MHALILSTDSLHSVVVSEYSHTTSGGRRIGGVPGYPRETLFGVPGVHGESANTLVPGLYQSGARPVQDCKRRVQDLVSS